MQTNQVKCYNAHNIFFMSFVSLQIPDGWSQQVCYARIMSYVVRYDLIYHSFPTNSQYLKTLGVDSPTNIFKTS